jgi:parallel beta-helix repeat protein
MKVKARLGLTLLTFVALISLFLSNSRAAAPADPGATADAVWSVAVLDQLLAATPPGQNTVQVGDMMVPFSYLQAWRSHLAAGPQANVAFNGGFTPWTGGNIYYSFSNNVSSVQQKAFLDGMAEWAMFASLHFILHSNEANYVLVYEQTAAEGGLSAVGMIGGEQTIQIGPTSWNRTTICHELGHTLGLVHEHQRSDRDNYVVIRTNNITPGDEGNFVLLTDSQNETAYDFLSVMHYSRNLLSTNPAADTIDPLAAYTNYLNTMGQLSDPVLSAADRAGMAAVYGPGPPLTNIVTNTQDSGPGSLRAALYYAFDHPGTKITFDIPVTDPGFSNNVFNIQPSYAEPGLWYNTTLDGSTEPVQSNPNGPAILLNGVLAWPLDTFPSGLQFRGTNNVARSFVINNFPESGVLFDGTSAIGNTVSGCYLGIDPTGSNAVPDGICPVQISGGASANLVGGTTAAARNVIGGGVFQGIAIRDPGTCFNVVEGNYIGLNAAGTAQLSNTWAGIQIFNGAESNLIGGYTASARNVISGNGLQGIAISDTNTSGNIVAGNYLGLDPTGTAAFGNGTCGVDIFGNATANLVGGTVPGAANMISGNGAQGLLIQDAGTSSNLVQGNFIGLNATGTSAVPNGWAAGGFAGVEITGGAQDNVIGGLTASARNIISGNTLQGAVIDGTGTSGNLIQGNYIGVNPAGNAALGNNSAGIDIFSGATGSYVGGNILGAGNVISGNGLQGVLIQYDGTSGNYVQGNYIGLNAAGNAAISNAWSGVEINNGPSGNLIGGYGGARNFISGNGEYGAYIDFANGNAIQGNTIGLDAKNGAVVPNGFAAGFATVGIYEASSNLLGGVGPGAANIICGSPYVGVQVDWDATNNTIRGNSIFGNTYGAISEYSDGNNDLASPTLISAVVTTNTVVSGSYTGVSGQSYLIDFYADAPPASSAEAMTYLGSISVTGTGSAVNFTANLGARLPAGRAVTATATDPFGNTSQLSTGIAATMTSSVNDGIPDAWRQLYFGGSGTTTNSQSDAFADADHTGMDNYQKFFAGLNPTNAASVFKLTALNPSTSTNAVSLNSASGFIYRVFACDDLTAGNWAILADQIIGTGTNMLFCDPAAPVSANRFYRAEVLW